MTSRFHAIAGPSTSQKVRRCLYPFWVFGLVTLIDSLHLGQAKWWHWPPSQESLVTWGIFSFVMGVIGYFGDVRSQVVGLNYESPTLVIHREAQTIPLFGRFFRPLSYPIPESRITLTSRGLLLSMPKQDAEFKWNDERTMHFPDAARPALEAWLAQLGQPPMNTDGQR